MTSFGWDYPPGCHSVPGDEDFPCEVCGRDCEECICPECPECGEQGYSQCYLDGHLEKSAAQVASLEAAEAEWRSEAAAEAAAEAAERVEFEYFEEQMKAGWKDWDDAWDKVMGTGD